MKVPTIRGLLPCLLVLACACVRAQDIPAANENALVLEVRAPHDALSFTRDWWGESDPLYWISTASDPYSLLRFADLAVPQGARITHATLTVWSYNHAVDEPADAVTLWVEQTDDAARVTSPADAWARKDARGLSVTWSTTRNGRDQPQPSPDLSAMLQQIVDRPGWVSGNAVQFFAHGTASPAHDGRQMHSYVTGTAGATRARLEVGYVVASAAVVRSDASAASPPEGATAGPGATSTSTSRDS